MILDPSVHPKHGREFAIRYYRWALDQWPSEVAAGFPMLQGISGIGGVEMSVDLEILRKMDPIGRLALGHALVRAGHNDALSFLGERLSQDDERLVSQFNGQREEALTDFLMSAAWTRGGAWAASRVRGRPAEAQSAIRKQVRELLEPILGRVGKRLGRDDWRYRTPVGEWTIETCVGFSMNTCDLWYSHHVKFGEETNPMCSFLSAEEWMGLNASGTGWVLSSSEDIPSAATALASLCQRCLAAAPALLSE